MELLGYAWISRAQAEHHLVALADAFDAANVVSKTPFFSASNISNLARPISIDGSREVIAHGHHRKAAFWMVATYS